MPAVRSSAGFTLVELLVALTLGGLVVLLVAQTFASLATSHRILQAEHQAFTRRANAHRWLHAAFLSLEVGAVPGESFEGQPQQTVFTTWEVSPRGWFERRRVILGRMGGTLQARLDDGTTIILADSLRSTSIDYLLTPGAVSRWVSVWSSPVSAPLAVRLRLTPIDSTQASDTVLFLIKERG
jgi:prepilin-type N-terminal cleavage/methylation domain-containing protein